MSKTPFP